MSSVVRTTTGMTMIASAQAPASPEKPPIGLNDKLVDEQADDDGGGAEEDVVHEADDLRRLVVAAIFRHIGSGQNAERRADERREHGHDQAADDGVQQTALRERRRRRHGEDIDAEPAEAFEKQLEQDEHERAKAERGRRVAQRPEHEIGGLSGGDRGHVFGLSLQNVAISGAGALVHPHQHETRNRKHDEGDDEQHEPKREERRQQLILRLAEFACDAGRDRRAWIEQRCR